MYNKLYNRLQYISIKTYRRTLLVLNCTGVYARSYDLGQHVLRSTHVPCTFARFDSCSWHMCSSKYTYPLQDSNLCAIDLHRYPCYKGAIINWLFIYITKNLNYMMTNKLPKQRVELKFLMSLWCLITKTIDTYDNKLFFYNFIKFLKFIKLF